LRTTFFNCCLLLKIILCLGLIIIEFAAQHHGLVIILFANRSFSCLCNVHLEHNPCFSMALGAKIMLDVDDF
jgi:hypothetical protein